MQDGGSRPDHRRLDIVLAPSGQFIVSTPNKLYYTESRGAEGRIRFTCTNSISTSSAAS